MALKQSLFDHSSIILYLIFTLNDNNGKLRFFSMLKFVMHMFFLCSL